MTNRARLIPVSRPSTAEAVVLVLHGGASRRGNPMVSPAQLSVLRMIPVARRLARLDRSVAVYRLLNSTRGWDTSHTPVDDVRWALGEVGRAHPGLPIGLLGHSLGGRAALLAAEQPGVTSVVLLNAYLSGVEVPPVRGTAVAVVHGDRDRIASPAAAEQVARRLRATTRCLSVTVVGGKHAMLRHARTFERVAADLTLSLLTGRTPRRPHRLAHAALATGASTPG